MGAALPPIEQRVFEARLGACCPEPLAPETVARLFLHYQELRRWNPALSLVGPGTRDELVERHYGESLGALPLIERRSGRLIDLGSGAGFPGWVLAAALPDLEVTLVESRQRKCSFLRSASRRAALPCNCLNARVGPALGEEIPHNVDLVTVRAVKLSTPLLAGLLDRLHPEGSVLIWQGAERPILPPGAREGRSRRIAGSDRRRIVEIRLDPGAREKGTPS